MSIFLNFSPAISFITVRAVEEGWFPPIAPPDVPSETVYGSCMDIYNRTWEGKEVVHTYPWGDRAYWRGRLENETDEIGKEEEEYDNHRHKRSNVPHNNHFKNWGTQILIVAVLALGLLGWRRYSKYRSSKKHEYTEIQT